MTREELIKAIKTLVEAINNRGGGYSPARIHSDGSASVGGALNCPLAVVATPEELAAALLPPPPPKPWENKTLAELPLGQTYKRRIDDECWLYIHINSVGGLDFVRFARNDGKSYTRDILQSDLAATDWQPWTKE